MIDFIALIKRHVQKICSIKKNTLNATGLMQFAYISGPDVKPIFFSNLVSLEEKKKRKKER